MITRYSMSWNKDEDDYIYVSPTEQPKGNWVKWEDYALLKAEVERLEHQVNYWRIEAEVDNARWLRCLQDLEELRASSFVTAVPVEHYERVVKAGDAMALKMSKMKMNPYQFSSLMNWNAAKEGKPSV